MFPILVCLGILAWLLWYAAPPVGPERLEDDELASKSSDEPPDTADGARLAGRPPKASAATPVMPTSVCTPFALIGRVVGAGRWPAAGIEVVLRIEGERDASGTTAGDGSFRLVPQRLPDRAWCNYAVIARDGKGNATVRNGRLRQRRTEDLPLRTLVLGASHALSVRVQAGGEPHPGATVEMWGKVGIRHGMLFRAVTDAGGIARLDSLPTELMWVLAYASGFAPTKRLTSLPRPPDHTLTVDLQPERTLDVHVVQGEERRPVAGVEVVVYDVETVGRGRRTSVHRPVLEIPVTNSEGRTRIAHIGRNPSLRLGVSAQGFAIVQGRRVFGSTQVTHKPLIEIPPQEDTLTVVLPATRTIVWPIEEGEIPVPADGTPVTLIEDPTAWAPFFREAARIQGGLLHVDSAVKGAFHALARLPDGALARLEAPAERVRCGAIRFRRPRRVTVTARDVDGAPVPDLLIWVKGPRGESLAPAGRTGADGIARITGLYGGMGRVSVHSPAHALGEVDLDEGDGEFQFVLDVPSEARPRLRLLLTLDGKAALPEAYTVYCEHGHLKVLEELPGEGAVDLEWTPKPQGPRDRLTVRALGYVTAQAPFTANTGEVRVALLSGGLLTIRVLHERDQRASPQLDRADPTSGVWRQVMMNVSRMRPLEAPSVGSLYPLHSLRPGRYRARLRKPLRTSSVATVLAGQATPILELDARGAGTVSGSIEAPDGAKLDLAYVDVADAAQPGSTRSVEVDARGRFTLPWPETPSLTLTVRHPLLRAHAATGAQVLTKPKGDLRLRLIETPRLSLLIDAGKEGKRALRVSARPRIVMGRAGASPARVLQLRGHVSVQPDGSSLVEIAAYDPGTWSLWLDASPLRAPLFLEGLVLGELDEDLDRYPLPVGSAVTLTLQTNGEAAPELVMVTAVHQGEPRYERTAFAEGSKVVRVRGLGPGRFRLRGGRVTPADEALTEIDLVVDVDGRTDLERTVDLR